MKRLFSVLLIALLLFFPVLITHADNGQYVYVDDDILTAEELQSVNDRAVEIAENRGVGVYYFYYSDVEDLPSYITEFAAEHVVEENALVFGFNADYRYALQIGPIAEAALNDEIVDGPIMDAYRSVTGDPERKLLAFLNAADAALGTYFENQGANASGETEPFKVPDYIARTNGGKPALVDEYGLLSESDAEALSKRLVEIGNAYRCDVIVVTVPDLGNKTAEEFADDYFDYNGYGYGATPDATGKTIDGDGVLLLLSMADRDFAVSTSGYAITAFTDYGIQTYLEGEFLPYFRNNDFGQGFVAFANGCEHLLDMARSGMPYDVTHIVSDPLYMTETDVKNANRRSENYAEKHGIAAYFFRIADATDLDAFMSQFVGERVNEPNAIVFGANASEHRIFLRGSAAKEKFSGEDLKAIEEAVVPYLDADDTNGAVTTYLNGCEKVFDRHPINIFALIASLFGGGALAFGPVNKMKRQMTSVTKQTSADRYLAPQSFTLTQNSDVLLGTNVSRSVHVVQTASSGGRSGSGGGFHGGSSTHTSSSGGTHGGHSGKF